MSRTIKPVLSEKHLKALALIERGGLSLKDIAAKVGWGPDYLYKLYEGDTTVGGSVASLFVAEVRKIDKKKSQAIKELAKTNKSLAHEQVKRILSTIKRKPKMSENDRKIVISAMNALAKASPKVEIGSLSYSYTKGFTAEQLIYEFRRLKSLAEGTSDRRRVQSSEQGRPGALPDSSGYGDETEEEL